MNKYAHLEILVIFSGFYINVGLEQNTFFEVSQVPGRFGDVGEACRIHFHLFSYL